MLDNATAVAALLAEAAEAAGVGRVNLCGRPHGEHRFLLTTSDGRLFLVKVQDHGQIELPLQVGG